MSVKGFNIFMNVDGYDGVAKYEPGEGLQINIATNDPEWAFQFACGFSEEASEDKDLSRRAREAIQGQLAATYEVIKKVTAERDALLKEVEMLRTHPTAISREIRAPVVFEDDIEPEKEDGTCVKCQHSSTSHRREFDGPHRCQVIGCVCTNLREDKYMIATKTDKWHGIVKDKKYEVIRRGRFVNEDSVTIINDSQKPVVVVLASGLLREDK